MPATDQKFVEVYRAANLAQAHAIQLALHEADIPVVIANSNAEQAAGDVPCGWATAPRLMVDQCQLAQAQQIIRQSTPDSTSSAESGLSLSEVFGLIPLLALGPVVTAVAVADFLVPDAKPVEVEPTCCLACGAEMPDADTRCSQCGWTYESESGSSDQACDVVTD